MLSHARRAGATLVELLVALTLAAIVLGTAASSMLRQQRSASSLLRAAASDAQLRAATGALAAELAALTRGSGDLTSGEASDTAVQLRSLVAAGLSCADAVGSALFAPADDSSPAAVTGSAPRVGDSLWWYGGAPRRWQGSRIVLVDSILAPCPLLSAPAAMVRRMATTGRDSITYGAPLRVTRPARYDFYRSGDGTWQLGLRDWNEVTRKFAAPQPVAGPFAMRAGAMRTGFRYYGDDGVELGGDVLADRVARIRVTVVALDVGRGQAGRVGVDSVDVALQHGAAPE